VVRYLKRIFLGVSRWLRSRGRALLPHRSRRWRSSRNAVHQIQRPPLQLITARPNLNVFEIEDNPFQPRREFGESELASLSESLKEHNILQPILVRIVDGRYQLISGERRLRAAIKANWQTIPARIRTADDRLVSELAIVENLQRKDLNAIEKAMNTTVHKIV